MQLTQDGFARARGYLYEQARPLERALFRRVFEDQSVDAASAELARFQNGDGGFGNAIEPDFRAPQSSPMATTVGLQVAVELELDGAHPIVARAVDYLEGAFDEALDAWPSTPSTVNDFPHAPWWHRGETIDAKSLRLNPGVEIAAYIIRWGSMDLAAWIAKTLSMAELLSPDQLLCCIRLAQTPGLDTDAQGAVSDLIEASLPTAVEQDPNRWTAYCIKPLTAAPFADSLLADPLSAAVETQLDFEIERQDASGAWQPHWTWGTQYPTDWEIAKAEWSGVITLEMLRSLAAFGRID